MTNAGRKKDRKVKQYKDIEWNIKHTNRINYLEQSIVDLVEWREMTAQSDDNCDLYNKSRDLLDYAFDKYNDMLAGKVVESSKPFCEFLYN